MCVTKNVRVCVHVYVCVCVGEGDREEIHTLNIETQRERKS